jgi:large subunit ribosomal protein L10
MSKQIKQMEMDALKSTFKDVKDMVFLSISGVDSKTDNQLRLGLRKKNIRLQVLKNSLARRVFDELGVKITSAWEKSTTVAWGGASLADLSRELDAIIKKNEKIVPKLAISEGTELPFRSALTMPTKPEAIGRVVALAKAPASRLMSQILAPAARVVGQIKTLAEKSPEPAPAA